MRYACCQASYSQANVEAAFIGRRTFSSVLSMCIRFVSKFFTLLLLFVSFYVRVSQGQQTGPSTEVASSSNATQPDLQAILARLEQQEAELQELRSRLGMASASGQSNNGSSFAAASYPIENTTRDINFELHQRIESLEKRLEQQTAAPAAEAKQPYEIGSDKKLTAFWNNGLELKNATGDYRIHIGGATNFDINAFDTDPFLEVPHVDGGIGPNPDSMQIRRGRITIDGTFYEVIEFKTEYEFANFLTQAQPNVQAPVANSPGFTDFWIQWKKLPVVGNIRAGNQKEPLGMEHMMSFKFTDFSERSYLQDMVFGPFNNGFNPGISMFNISDDERWTWAIGGFGNNSDPWGYSIGDDWALTGRTTYLLYYDEPSNGRYLWEIGAAGSVRKPDEDIVRIRTRGNIRSGPPGAINPIYADSGNILASQQEILALESAMQWGRLSLQGEYVGTWVEGAIQPFLTPPSALPPNGPPVARGTPFFQGGYVSLMYFLTGENRNYNKQLAALDRVVPSENFFWVDSAGGHCWGWGAWQIGARLSFADLNDNGINGGQLNSCTFGVNWFLNPNSKVQFNYDITHRSQVQNVAAGNIDAFGARFAYDF